MPATAGFQNVVIFSNPEEYAQYWTGCGKPAQFNLKTKGNLAFIFQGALVSLNQGSV